MEYKRISFWTALHQQTQAGFTLIEIIIAIVLLASLMTGVYTITVNSVDTKDRVVSEDRSFMQVETALHRLQVDISQLYSPLYFGVTEKESQVIKTKMGVQTQTQDASSYDNTQSEPRTNTNFPLLSARGELIPEVFNPEKGTLVFFTTANRRFLQDAKESQFAWVRYSVVENTEASNKEAPFQLIRQVYTADPFTDELNWDTQKQMILLNNIKEFSFLFWDERTKKYADTLRVLNENHFILRAIKVRLTWVDETQGEFTFERIMRPPWPYFDRQSDEAERWTEFRNKNNNGTGGNSGGQNFNDSFTPPPEDF